MSLAGYAAEHPEVTIAPGRGTGGHLFAWVQTDPDDPYSGELAHDRTEAGLLAKLTAKLAG